MADSIIRLVESDIERPNHGPEPADFAFEGSPIEKLRDLLSNLGLLSFLTRKQPVRPLHQAQGG